MKFAAFQWLYGLIALIPIWFFLERLLAKRQASLARFASIEILKSIAPELDWRSAPRKLRLTIFSAAFVLIALARPQWGQHDEMLKVSGLDIVLTLDISNSMEVEDVVPNRLKKMKHVVRTFLEKLQGDRVGLVAFAGSAYSAAPLTTDLSYILDSVEILTPKMISNQGTDIGSALMVAADVLDRAAETTKKGSRVIVLVTDGEDQEAKALQIAEKIKTEGIMLYILGVGSAQGGPIPLRDESGMNQGYKRDSRGTPIVSSFNGASLIKLGETAGGRYWPVTELESEVSELAGELGKLTRQDFSERKFVTYEERYQIPLAIAILLLLMEICLPARKLGALAGVILLLVLIRPTEIFGSTPIESYLKNEAGLKAMREGKIEDAQKSFGEAQALAPTSPELLFNQGVAQLVQKDAEKAVQRFSDAALQAARAGDRSFESEAKYNQALAEQIKGDFKASAKSYAASILRASQSGNVEAAERAKKNLRLLKKQEEEQKKQQDQKKEEQDKQDKQDNQQQGGQGESKDKDKKDDPGQQKKYQDNAQQRQQPFESKKLSPGDAKRVMDELASREKELQAKLKGKKRGQSVGGGRDW